MRILASCIGAFLTAMHILHGLLSALLAIFGSVADTSPRENRAALLMGVTLIASNFVFLYALANSLRRRPGPKVIIALLLAGLPVIACIGYVMNENGWDIIALAITVVPFLATSCWIMLYKPDVPDEADPRCPACNYSLLGLTTPTRPECGNPVRPLPDHSSVPLSITTADPK